MKKLFALILAVSLMATMSVTAFAANTTGGSTEVSFNVDPTYTVTIPATVELNKVEPNKAAAPNRVAERIMKRRTAGLHQKAVVSAGK